MNVVSANYFDQVRGGALHRPLSWATAIMTGDDDDGAAGGNRLFSLPLVR